MDAKAKLELRDSAGDGGTCKERSQYSTGRAIEFFCRTWLTAEPAKMEGREARRKPEGSCRQNCLD